MLEFHTFFEIQKQLSMKPVTLLADLFSWILPRNTAAEILLRCNPLQESI